ncbi:hypothetical protein EDB89DRAFT_146665 [Lactarius sanguifluus]|nr:hypothetical protein EDB89DRAFT_146665 [Lactarius sanguifluus]
MILCVRSRIATTFAAVLQLCSLKSPPYLHYGAPLTHRLTLIRIVRLCATWGAARCQSMFEPCLNVIHACTKVIGSLSIQASMSAFPTHEPCSVIPNSTSYSCAMIPSGNYGYGPPRRIHVGALSTVFGRRRRTDGTPRRTQ